MSHLREASAPRRHALWLSEGRLALLCGLVVLGIGCYQLSRPNVLGGVLGWNLGYDDGVYLGAAVRLVNGVLPYRDFVLVQPPGIVYLLTPDALLSFLVGTHDALMIARVLTVVVVGANAALAGYLLRDRGRVAAVVGGLACALWPTTVSVDRTVELEPYLTFFCLLGAIAVFGGASKPSNRRLVLAGALFGGACVTKVWAIFPLFAVIVCLLPALRRVARFLLGAVTAGIVLCLPFLIASPVNFFRDVFVAQINRKVNIGGSSMPLLQRFVLITGLSGFSWLHDATGYAVGLSLVFVLLLANVISRHWRDFSQMEWFCVLAAIASLAGTFGSPQLYDHYSYFPAVFLALVVGVLAGYVRADLTHAARWLQTHASGVFSSASRRARLLVVLAVVAVALVGVLVEQESSYGAKYLGEASNPGPALAAAIPKGACAVSDDPVDLLVANRFTPSTTGCPAVVDPFGMYLVYDSGNAPHPYPPFPAAFTSLWKSMLEQTSYLDLRVAYSDFLPWSKANLLWFPANFRLVATSKYTYPHPFIDHYKNSYIYERISK